MSQKKKQNAHRPPLPQGWSVAEPYARVATLEAFAPALTLNACAYIVGGGTASGKTTAARTIALACDEGHVPCRLIEFDEPGTAASTPASRLFEGDEALRAGAVASSGRRATSADVNRHVFHQYLEWWRIEGIALGRGGVLVLDSIWSWLAFASSLLEMPSPKGGVHPAYANAARALDKMASSLGIAIIAVQNTELFPIPHLEGAAGGQIVPSGGAPVMSVRDRNMRVMRQFMVNHNVWTRVQQLRGGE